MKSQYSLSVKKTVLSLAIASLFPSLSFAALTNSADYETSETVQIDGSLPDSKLGGLIADGQNITVNIADEQNLTVAGDIKSDQASNVYAIFVDTDGMLQVTGDLNVDLISETSATAARLDSDSVFDGNVDLKVQGAGSAVLGINIQSDSVKHVMEFNGEKTDISVTAASDGSARLINNNGGNGTELNINSDQIVLSLDHSAGTGNTQGIYAYRSSVNLNGDTELIVKGNETYVYGVNTEGDLGDGYDSVVNFNGGKTAIDVSGKGEVWALTPSGNTAMINLTGEQISIKAATEAGDGVAIGVGTQYGAQLNVTNPNALTEITVESAGDAFGLYNTTYGSEKQNTVQYGSINIAGDTTINVSGQGSVVGILNQLSEDWDVDINNENDGIHLTGKTSMTVKASGAEAAAYGVLADNLTSVSATASVDVENLNASVQGIDGAASYGVFVANHGTTNLSGTTSIEAGGEKAYGIILAGSGQLDVDGTMSVSGDTEGIVIDSTSEMGLADNASVSTNSMQSDGQTTMAEGSRLTVGGSEGSSSSLGNIQSRSATVNFVGGSYSVGTVTGTNATFNVESTAVRATLADNQSTGLLITSSSDVTDALKGQILDRLLTIESGGEGVEFYMPEGMYEGAQSGTYGEDGKVATQTIKTNTLMQSSLELGSAAPLALNRMMMTDLRKRMGDIRSDENTYGAWARYEGGSLSGSNGLDNTFHSVHVGGDAKVDSWRIGAGFNYINGDVDYARGDADMDSYGLSLYGMWLGEAGQFVDIVARINKADTDMTVDGYKTGSMDGMAYSLSGEFGWRFALSDMVYVEPQIEAAYTYIDTDDLNISSWSYKFDSVNSFIGRAGFAAGVKCPNNYGDVYMHVSALHEFSGDSEITGGNGTSYKMDGKDTWVEYGIGANFNINKSTYVWADVQRTSGATLDEDWRANVGVRYAF